MRKSILSLSLLALTAVAAAAADWPNFRGPAHNGISAESVWGTRWPAGGPRRLWTAQVGEGYSGISVAAGRAYTVGNDGRQDTIHCFDAANGRSVWRYSYPCAPGDYGGPRATPAVSSGKVYMLSREGLALCLDAVRGRLIWRRDVAREAKASAPQWGFAGSPLVAGNNVLFNVGTAGVALNKDTGRVVWVSGDKMAGYATPVPFSTGKQSGVAFFVAWGVVAVNPDNGRPLWQYPWQTQYDVNAADPVFSGNRLLLSSNYEKGAALLKIGEGRPQPLWETRQLRSHTNPPVSINGAFFGNDQGRLRCIDAGTGRNQWEGTRMGRGGLIVADNKLLVVTDRGELVVAAADPARYTELSRAKVVDGECWTAPTLANGLLYVRSHEGNVACFDLRVR